MLCLFVLLLCGKFLTLQAGRGTEFRFTFQVFTFPISQLMLWAHHKPRLFELKSIIFCIKMLSVCCSRSGPCSNNNIFTQVLNWAVSSQQSFVGPVWAFRFSPSNPSLYLLWNWNFLFQIWYPTLCDMAGTCSALTQNPIFHILESLNPLGWKSSLRSGSAVNQHCQGHH